MTQLLGSQTSSDVVESIRALVSAHAFELNGARPASILVLVWSREPSIKQAALDAAQVRGVQFLPVAPAPISPSFAMRWFIATRRRRCGCKLAVNVPETKRVFC